MTSAALLKCEAVVFSHAEMTKGNVAGKAHANDWDSVLAMLPLCPAEEITMFVHGWTVLHLAARAGIAPAVEAIIARCAPLNHAGDAARPARALVLDERLKCDGGCSNTALLLACEFGNDEVVRQLCEAGANLLAVNQQKRSALTRALLGGSSATAEAMRKRRDICACLVRTCAQRVPNVVLSLVNHQTDEGWQALHIASHMGSAEFVEGIVSSIPAAQRDAVVSAAQQFGARSPPLVLASETGDVDTVKALLRFGANVLQRDVGGARETGLLKAVAFNRHAAVRVLVEHALLCGGERMVLEMINAARADGWKALHIAVLKGSGGGGAELVDALLAPLTTERCRATVLHTRLSAPSGPFPLHMAVEQQHAEVVATLCKYGASLTLRDQGGRIALQLAQFGGDGTNANHTVAKRDAVFAALGGVGPALRVGERVVLCGLKAKAHLNNRVGVVEAYSASKLRWLVRVDGEPVTPGALGAAASGALLRPINLLREGATPLVPPPSPEQAAARPAPTSPLPSPSASASGSGSGSSTEMTPGMSLREVLATERLVECAEAALLDLGAVDAIDLLDLDDDDVAALPLKSLQLKRFKRLLRSIRDAPPANAAAAVAADVPAPAPAPAADVVVAGGGGSAGTPSSSERSAPVGSRSRESASDVAMRRAGMASESVGRFHVGDRVKSLVQMPEWQPRPLEIGAEGTITGNAPPPHGATVDFGGTPALTGRLMLAQLCQPEEWLARMGVYAVGDKVKSIVAADNTIRPLAMGEDGVVLGLAPPPEDLVIDFGGEPRLVTTVHFSDICLPASWEATAAAQFLRLGNFRVGDTVRSLIPNPGWHPRPLFVGDVGTIEGPAPLPHEVTVKFGGTPSLTGRMLLNQVCSDAEWGVRLGPFKPGDRVRSRVKADHWRPRSLRVGDEGVIKGPAPPPHDITVDFGGIPTLVGMLKIGEVVKLGEEGADFGQQWPEPLGAYVCVCVCVVQCGGPSLSLPSHFHLFLFSLSLSLALFSGH